MEILDWDILFGAGGGAFATNKFATDKFGGSTWMSFKQDIRTSEPIVLEYGILGSDPTDLVAGPGSLSFALNNGAWNSGGVMGWFSPLNALKRGGFNFNIPVRLVLTYAANPPIYKFAGRLADILVTPGEHEDRMVYCKAFDLMEDYSRLPVPSLDAQFGKRGDELVQMVLNALPADLQPNLRAISTGLSTYDVSLDLAHEDSQTIRELFYDLCVSEMATINFVGTSATGGGLFSFQNRQTAALNPIVFHTFESDIARGGLVVPGSRDDIVSKVQVFAHPVRIDDVASVLYGIDGSPIQLQAGATTTLFGSFQDASDNDIGGMNLLPLVAGTDYTLNTSADGTGINVTGLATVSAAATGTGVRFTVTNGAPAPAWILSPLQVRGFGIHRSETMVEKEVPDVPYGHSVVQIDMPYQSDTNVATAAAEYLSNSLSRIYARATSITFLANLNATLMSIMLALEPGHRIGITEDVTGLFESEFTINGVRLELVASASGLMVWCTWFLKPADTQHYWFMGSAGASELGVTTVLGY